MKILIILALSLSSLASASEKATSLGLVRGPFEKVLYCRTADETIDIYILASSLTGYGLALVKKGRLAQSAYDSVVINSHPSDAFFDLRGEKLFLSRIENSKGSDYTIPNFRANVSGLSRLMDNVNDSAEMVCFPEDNKS